jgi:hypothetical protein
MIAAVFDGQTQILNGGLTILFHPIETRPVGKRKGYFQLNASVPFIGDYKAETENPF